MSTKFYSLIDQTLSKSSLFLVGQILAKFPQLRPFFWENWYNFISKNPQRGTKWTFMNYGYTELDSIQEATARATFQTLNIGRIHGGQDLMARLYHHLCTVSPAVDFTDKEVVEIGSGRGGGAAFIALNFPLKKYTGIDLSPKAITFCQKNYADIKKLRFQRGNSQSLSLEDSVADIVINVESSHCYANFSKFVHETYRILKPGGFFLFTDFRDKELVPTLNDHFHEAGFKILLQKNIAPNVLNGLQKESAEKKEFLQRTFPVWMQGVMGAFAGLEGTFVYNGFASGETCYPLFILQK